MPARRDKKVVVTTVSDVMPSSDSQRHGDHESEHSREGADVAPVHEKKPRKPPTSAQLEALQRARDRAKALRSEQQSTRTSPPPSKSRRGGSTSSRSEMDEPRTSNSKKRGRATKRDRSPSSSEDGELSSSSEGSPSPTPPLRRTGAKRNNTRTAQGTVRGSSDDEGKVRNSKTVSRSSNSRAMGMGEPPRKRGRPARAVSASSSSAARTQPVVAATPPPPPQPAPPPREPTPPRVAMPPPPPPRFMRSMDGVYYFNRDD